MVEAREILKLRDIPLADITQLLHRYQLCFAQVADDQVIPGSYWGESEAGIIGTTVYARNDTPIHSILHEACHLIVMPAERRNTVDTNASDCIEEENATCYLQILLADALPGVGRDRLMTDMDAWGYTFRLGSARAWFEQETDSERRWLQARALLPLAQVA